VLPQRLGAFGACAAPGKMRVAINERNQWENMGEKHSKYRKNGGLYIYISIIIPFKWGFMMVYVAGNA